MSDRKREHEVDSHEIKRYRREEMEKEEQNESDDSDYQLYIPLKERRKEKGDQKQVNPQESRSLAIGHCLQSLKHACQCRDANCRLPSCQRMKRIILHAKSCTMKGTNTCAICKQLIALNCYHAKTCQEAKCPVPFCTGTYKFKQQRLNKAQILKRRIAMQNMGMTETVKQASLGNAGLTIQPSPDPKPQASSHLSQPGIGMNLAACPPVIALQTVSQVQAAAERQILPHMVFNARQALPRMVGGSVNYGNTNPVLNHLVSNPALIRTPQQMQKPVNQMLPGVSNCMPNDPRNSAELPQMLVNTGSTQAILDNLLATLKASNFSSHHKQHVLALLKSNPQLMAAFIKKRTQRQKQMIEQ